MEEGVINSSLMQKFQQRQAGTKTWFEFTDRELNYSAVDSSGAIKFSVGYEEITPTERQVFHRSYWARNAGVILLVFTIVYFMRAFIGTGDYFPATFFASFSIIAFGYFHFNKRDMTIFDTQHGHIVILDVQHHDEIKSLITEKRKIGLLAWFGNTDFTDNSAAEIEALEWLVKAQAMSREEADERITDLRSNTDELSKISGTKPASKKLH